MENFNSHAPCLDKECSWCCNPVKIDSKKILNGMVLPKDINGDDLFQKRGEVLLPEEKIETSKVFAYDCKNFDKDSGLCNDYENRPEICRNATCIDVKSDVNIDEQHKKATEQKFIKIIPMR